MTLNPHWQLGGTSRGKGTTWNGNFRHSLYVICGRVTSGKVFGRFPSCTGRYSTEGEEFWIGGCNVELFDVTITAVGKFCHSLNHFITKKIGWKSRKTNLKQQYLLNTQHNAILELSFPWPPRYISEGFYYALQIW